MTDEPDVAIVGAGIAGGAMATVLARGGLDVLVLERTLQHEDRVRGEYMQPWGVAEAKRNALFDVLLGAGGNVLRRLIRYSDLVTPEEAEASAVDLRLLPEVEGALGVGHPSACDAFDAAAISAGAALVRGVSTVTVTAGEHPDVTYTLDGAERRVRPRLIIGADGRESTIRKQLGFELHATESAIMGAGLLVSEVRGWNPEQCVIGTEGSWNFLAFPQGPDTARLYLMYEMAHKDKLRGAGKAEAFLGAFRCDAFPKGVAFADATPAGPCAAFPMNDTWVDEPVTGGVVLIGDAAGWSDPLIGQGLSVAMRDVRLVGEVLLGGGDWSPSGFKGYVEERTERMRRLRYAARVIARVGCDSAAGALERRRALTERLGSDLNLAMVIAIAVLGPEFGPPEVFTEETLALLFRN